MSLNLKSRGAACAAIFFILLAVGIYLSMKPITPIEKPPTQIAAKTARPVFSIPLLPAGSGKLFLSLRGTRNSLPGKDERQPVSIAGNHLLEVSFSDEPEDRGYAKMTKVGNDYYSNLCPVGFVAEKKDEGTRWATTHASSVILPAASRVEVPLFVSGITFPHGGPWLFRFDNEAACFIIRDSADGELWAAKVLLPRPAGK